MHYRSDIDGCRSRCFSREHPHGTRLRYLQGCKCVPCRAANSRYECSRVEARKNGDWNGVVRADRARAHILALSRLGVGYKSVAKAAKVGRTIIAQIVFGGKKKIRARTERKILSVTQAALPKAAIVPAAPFWKLLNELLAKRRHTRGQVALLLGSNTPALQIRKDRILWGTALKIIRLHRMLTERREFPVRTAWPRELTR